jgi:hypothetical protein
VDVHRPGAVGGSFRIGANGLDFEDLQNSYLPTFGLHSVWTAGHLGYLSNSATRGDFHAKEMRLAEKFPLEGSVFTAYWSRTQGA